MSRDSTRLSDARVYYNVGLTIYVQPKTKVQDHLFYGGYLNSNYMDSAAADARCRFVDDLSAKLDWTNLPIPPRIDTLNFNGIGEIRRLAFEGPLEWIQTAWYVDHAGVDT